MDQPNLPLDIVQRWFQAVIVHPRGVHAGLATPQAQQLIRLQPEQAEQVLTRSRRLDSLGRLQIYADAYYARLIECLRESFPVLRRVLGSELFDEFAVGYLQAYPSRSYTLNRLGDAFATYLTESRPEALVPGIGWPELLVDLAQLECAIEQAFDGPGEEELPRLDTALLATFAPEAQAELRLRTAPSLRLLAFRFPVNDLYTQARQRPEDEELDLPAAEPTWLALSRRDYVVRRHPLTHESFALLQALQQGERLAAAIAVAAAGSDWSDEVWGAALRRWFDQWAASGFFLSVDVAGTKAAS